MPIKSGVPPFLVILSVKHETSNPFASKDTSANASNETKKEIMLSFTRVHAINSFLLRFFRVKERIAAHLFTLYAIVKYKVNKIKGVIFIF